MIHAIATLRASTMLLWCVAVLAASAAHAPVHRTPKPSRVWLDGWEEWDKLPGDCRLDRLGDKLTITMQEAIKDLTRFRLMQTVKGDFIMEVRIRGNFLDTGDLGWAGIEVLSERESSGAILTLGKAPGGRLSVGRRWYNIQNCCSSRCKGDLEQKDGSAYLRLERRGRVVHLDVSLDGKKWEKVEKSASIVFNRPGQVKIGVFATSMGKGEFKAVFDRLHFVRKD